MPYGYSPIPPSAVGTAQIIDESIQPADIDLDEDFEFGGDVEVGGDLGVTGTITAALVAPSALVVPEDVLNEWSATVRGALRINSCTGGLEYCDGQAWIPV